MSKSRSRKDFRGTGYHNTLKIDGVEQNEMNPKWFFRMFDSGTPEHLSFTDEGGMVEYHGRHIGYKRLKHPVVHDRYLRLLKGENVLFVADVLQGEGSHNLEWHYHCAPGVEITGDSGDEGGTMRHTRSRSPANWMISWRPTRSAWVSIGPAPWMLPCAP